MSGAEPGVRLGIDPGDVRIGVAISDRTGLIATPLCTVARDSEGGNDLAELAALVTEHDAALVVVGLPRSLSGRAGPAERSARAFAGTLAERITPVPVTLTDERLTTVSATRNLAERGVRGRKARSVVDRTAAAVILQAWLDAERSTPTSR